jgi:hypothetical protein
MPNIVEGTTFKFSLGRNLGQEPKDGSAPLSLENQMNALDWFRKNEK